MNSKISFKKIVIFLLVVFALSSLVGCSSSSSNWDRQVEKTKNELYYKGSDGLW